MVVSQLVNRPRRARPLVAALALGVLFAAASTRPGLARLAVAKQGSSSGKGVTVWVLTRDGRNLEGSVEGGAVSVQGSSPARRIPLAEVLSFASGAPAEATETERIAAGLVSVAGEDRPAREKAMAELADLGLPVLTPLLASYKDRDAREPDPLYHLFGRIMPGAADTRDRTLDVLRLADGTTLRGRVTLPDLKLASADGQSVAVPAAAVRRLAVRRREVDRGFDLQALRHCTYIEWLDTGIRVTPASKLESRATGLVRLDFNEDGWASDPDGIEKPLPGKRLLQDGFRWGIVLGRVGSAGERWAAGSRVEKADLGSGRLYYVINDNPHWQNNIGRYRVRLRVTDAYDVGDAD